MPDKLPPLPKEKVLGQDLDRPIRGYTAKAMRAYGRLCVAEFQKKAEEERLRVIRDLWYKDNPCYGDKE